jgi:hypothetical protein
VACFQALLRPSLREPEEDNYKGALVEPVKKNMWPESASEIYRPSDRRLSAKLVPIFVDRGVSRGQRSGSPTAVFSSFLTGAATFSFK